MTPLGEFLDHHLARYAIRRINRYAAWKGNKPFLVDWTGGMFMIPAKILRKVGGSDESMPLCYHDADFCERLNTIGIMRVVVPEAKVFHLWAGTTSRDPRTAYQPPRDFRTYLAKRWRFRRFVLWPLVLVAIVFSVPVVLAVKRKVPSKNLLAMRIG
jgi:GT2 family glycosyltransferase